MGTIHLQSSNTSFGSLQYAISFLLDASTARPPSSCRHNFFNKISTVTMTLNQAKWQFCYFSTPFLAFSGRPGEKPRPLQGPVYLFFSACFILSQCFFLKPFWYGSLKAVEVGDIGWSQLPDAAVTDCQKVRSPAPCFVFFSFPWQ